MTTEATKQSCVTIVDFLASSCSLRRILILSINNYRFPHFYWELIRVIVTSSFCMIYDSTNTTTKNNVSKHGSSSTRNCLKKSIRHTLFFTGNF